MTQQDALGRLTAVWEDPSGFNYQTTYGYDPLGNLWTVTQGAETRSFTYDSLSRLRLATNPESGAVQYKYDNAGNLKSAANLTSGKTTSYDYDALNRIKDKTYTDGTPAVYYTYDPAVPNGIGHLGSVTNASAQVNYTGFDAVGNVTAHNQQSAGQTYVFGYGYNLAGSLVTETYPSGRVVTTGYDGAGRPLSVNGSINGVQGTYASGVTYEPSGSYTAIPYGNGIVQHFWYDTRLRPQYMRSALQDRVGSTYLLLNPVWYANGNLDSVSENNGGPGYPSFLTFTQSFLYDNLNRVKSATDTGGWSRSFGYDRYGNMWLSGNTGVTLSGTTPTSNVFNSANRMAGVSYDSAGNQLNANGNALAYDAENRQIAVTEPAALGGGTESYYYDGNGKRVQKMGPAGTVVYVYDAAGPGTAVIFRAQQLAHALRSEPGHNTPLGTAEEIKTAVTAAVKAGSYSVNAGGVVKGTAYIQGVAHEFTGFMRTAGEIVFSNIYRK